jgi:hypothetical protein
MFLELMWISWGGCLSNLNGSSNYEQVIQSLQNTWIFLVCVLSYMKKISDRVRPANLNSSLVKSSLPRSFLQLSTQISQPPLSLACGKSGEKEYQNSIILRKLHELALSNTSLSISRMLAYPWWTSMQFQWTCRRIIRVTQTIGSQHINTSFLQTSLSTSNLAFRIQSSGQKN